MSKRIFGYHFLLTLSCAMAVSFSGCSAKKPANGLIPVKFQTDWYPQPEHGGFYDALVKGYYKEEGLDVTILPGGPYLNAQQIVATNAAEFGMTTSDKILESIGHDEPLIAIGATMQHDPQAIMVHRDSPIHSFADLDGHTIAVQPASTWFEYLVSHYRLTTVHEIPATFSVSNFLADPTYIQQIFITSEPFFARNAGAEIRTLMISDTGYDPYRAFFTTTSFLQAHPEVVEKFVRASLRGWRDYLQDPAAANETISRLNPGMNRNQMAFTYQALKDGNFVTGDGQLGQFDPARWSTMYRQLFDLKIVKRPFDPTIAYTREFLTSAPITGK